MVNVVVCGDLYPSVEAVASLKRGTIGDMFDGLLPLLRDAGLTAANMEGPLIKQPSPIQKIGPHHGFDDECVHGLRAAGFDVLNLGNNHVMDHGAEGMRNTLRVCRERGIECVGAGEDRDDAGRVMIKEVNGVRIGFLSYTEREFGIAGEHEPGTHPIDVVHFVRTVTQQRGAWDALIVLLHAGNEYYHYPRPSLRDLARFMIEQGAAAVIFQHSHCAGCYETYRGGHIVYGQGNFLFDRRGARPCEMEGMLVRLSIDSTPDIQLELIPFQQSASHPGPERMAASREKEFLTEVEKRSREIQQPGFVEEAWSRFCDETPYNYLALITGRSQKVRELDLKFRFLRRIYSPKRLLMLLHLLRCESHHEATIGALNNALAAKKSRAYRN